MANYELYAGTYVYNVSREIDGTWTWIGNDPWLDALDQPTNYITTTNKKAGCGDWSFQKRYDDTGNVGSVTFFGWGQEAVGGKTLEFFLSVVVI